jgi:hypothetical protein
MFICSLFGSNMHYNGANMSSMAAMHHGHGGLSQQQQQHDSAASSGHQHSNSSSSTNNNNGGSGSTDVKTLPPSPTSTGSAAGYSSYFGQLAANSVMDNVMCRPVH